MPNYVDALLDFQRYDSTGVPTSNPAAGLVRLTHFAGPGSQMQWRDENGNVFVDNLRVFDATASATVEAVQRDAVLRSTGATDITLTVDTHANQEFPNGTQIIFLRGGTGQLTIAFATGVTAIAARPTFPTDAYSLRQGEYFKIIKVEDDVWRTEIDPNFLVGSIPYQFHGSWQAAASNSSTVIIPATAWSDGMAVGRDSDTLGGLVAASIGALGHSSAMIRDSEGNALNAVLVRGVDKKYLLSSNSRMIFGLVQTTLSDGANNDGASTQISLVEWDEVAESWLEVELNQTVQFSLRLAVPLGWVPYEIDYGLTAQTIEIVDFQANYGVPQYDTINLSAIADPQATSYEFQYRSAADPDWAAATTVVSATPNTTLSNISITTSEILFRVRSTDGVNTSDYSGELSTKLTFGGSLDRRHFSIVNNGILYAFFGRNTSEQAARFDPTTQTISQVGSAVNAGTSINTSNFRRTANHFITGSRSITTDQFYHFDFANEESRSGAVDGGFSAAIAIDEAAGYAYFTETIRGNFYSYNLTTGAVTSTSYPGTIRDGVYAQSLSGQMGTPGTHYMGLRSGQIFKVDTTTPTAPVFTQIALAQSAGHRFSALRSGAEVNNKVYFMFQENDFITAIDRATDSVTRLPLPTGPTYGDARNSFYDVSSPLERNGYIYLAPDEASHFIRINTATDVVESFGPGLGTATDKVTIAWMTSLGWIVYGSSAVDTVGFLDTSTGVLESFQVVGEPDLVNFKGKEYMVSVFNGTPSTIPFVRVWDVSLGSPVLLEVPGSHVGSGFRSRLRGYSGDTADYIVDGDYVYFIRNFSPDPGGWTGINLQAIIDANT